MAVEASQAACKQYMHMLDKATFGYEVMGEGNFKDASEFEIALSIQPGSYLNHYSTMYLHGLIDNIPQIISTNKEQSKKPRYSSDLSQDNLDRAFAQPMRKTKQIAQYDRFKIYLLNGKHTGNLGVIDHE